MANATALGWRAAIVLTSCTTAGVATFSSDQLWYPLSTTSSRHQRTICSAASTSRGDALPARALDSWVHAGLRWTCRSGRASGQSTSSRPRQACTARPPVLAAHGLSGTASESMPMRTRHPAAIAPAEKPPAPQKASMTCMPTQGEGGELCHTM